MQFCKLKQDLKLPLLVTLISITILSFLLDQDRYSYSQSSKANSTINATRSGVDLINTQTLPTNVKNGSMFEILSTVVNNSPDTILLPAGFCDLRLSAFFISNNVVIRPTQSCNATSPPFQIKPGQEVTIAHPASGTIYQAIKAGKAQVSVTVYYLTEKGHPGNVTKPFVFTIN
jgi:hypothetical protein